jgi:hypothetical protein
LVVVDGVEGKPYEGISRGSPVFSPDGAHAAYTASEGGKQFIVVDGKEGKRYDIAGKSGILFDTFDTFHHLAVVNNLDLKLGYLYRVEQRIK